MIVLFHALKRKEERTGDEDRVQKPHFWAFLIILALLTVALTGCSDQVKEEKKALIKQKMGEIIYDKK